jgi:hypothetical protein
MIKVNIISRLPAERWLRYFPDPANTSLGNCNFIFDARTSNYDWAVVYEDLPKKSDNSSTTGKEKLACNIRNTLLVTTEPPNIKLYDKEYTRQFEYVLTSHPPEALPHSHRIYSQPALMWFCSDTASRWDFLQKPCPDKSKLISTVCSHKRQKHTLHNRRYDLTMELKPHLATEMDIYGRGIQHVENKAHMMETYQYHLAIENYNGPHHWTEKLADTFLSCSLPFYSGCSNLEEYFPEESYISIDLWNTEATLEIIRKAINNNEYQKRLTAIQEARRRVLEDYSFFATLNKIITENHSTETGKGEYLLSRHAIRRKYPLTCLPRAIKKEALQFIRRLSG